MKKLKCSIRKKEKERGRIDEDKAEGRTVC